MTMQRKLAIVALAFAGLAAPGSVPAQQPRQSQAVPQQQQQQQSKTYPQFRAQSSRPIYQRRDTWYEFLLKQFNPDNFDYGVWMEERRQVFLDESVHNPYFKYGAGVTLGLLLMTVICAKQWIDHRRTLWITAEMMADLYNHDLYSRDIAEKAIEKYNQHIKRCNRAIEAAQNGSTLPVATADADQLNAQLQKTAGETKRVNDGQRRSPGTADGEVQRDCRVVLASGRSVEKNGGNLASSRPIDLSGADPNLIKHINDLQEQLVVERKKNRQLKGA